MDRRRVLGAAAAVAGVAGLGAAVSGCSDQHTAAPVGESSPSKGPTASASVAEQDLPGNADWRLTSVGPQNAIEGYADKVSVLPGETVGLRVSTTSASFRVSAYRMGWYGGAEARLVWRSGPVPGTVQGGALFDGA